MLLLLLLLLRQLAARRLPHAHHLSLNIDKKIIPCFQVREDVTRYRYGDEQHLDEALTRIFR